MHAGMHVVFHIKRSLRTDFNKNRNVSIDFDEVPKVEFHENTFSDFKAAIYGQTGITKLMGAFLQLFVANMPKIVPNIKITDLFYCTRTSATLSTTNPT
jgi:hypothetical protein